MYKYSLTKSFLYPLIFPWRIEKCLPRLVILMTLWWWHFLAMLGTTQKVSRIARYLGCVGRSDLLRALQALKTRLLLRGRPGRRPFAAAIGGADTPKFRKQSYTFCNVEKLRRNSLVLPCMRVVSDISHQDIDAKVDDWWRVFKREHIYKNNLDKIWQN